MRPSAPAEDGAAPAHFRAAQLPQSAAPTSLRSGRHPGWWRRRCWAVQRTAVRADPAVVEGADRPEQGRLLMVWRGPESGHG